ncbi:MAG: hypothetical protein ACI9N1_002122, partial [Flavobacteriales bacterium]
SIIQEIDEVKKIYDSFEKFESNFLAKRAIERHLEIIGEAVNNLRKMDSDIKISNIKKSVNLRNLIIHSYDSVDSAILWGVIQKNIPVLKDELIALKKAL